MLEKVNENGRQLRFRGLNTYHRRFGMQSFTSFLDLAGDPKLAADLEHFCRDIEAVEYYVGECLCGGKGGGEVIKVEDRNRSFVR